jgi:KDO2-lipid IV(A) lauroyltransferase
VEHSVNGARASAAHAGEPTCRPLTAFFKPRYWPAWCLVSWLRLIALLPLEVALAIHRVYGRAMYCLAPRQRHVVRRNLELCFPALTPSERERLVKRHFESLGMSLAECAFAWLASDRRLASRFVVRGLEHLRDALAEGNGAILYTGHFGSLEICGRALKLALPYFACMFSRRGNPLLDEIQRRGRLRVAHETVASDQVRATLRALKRGAAVWYAPDQVHSHGVLLPFFGEPAMTNVATSKLARLSGAPILPFSYRRTDDRGHYELVVHARLTELPTADPVADTRALVHRLEEFIRAAPEQYQWLHRRFRGRPDLPDPYRAEAAPPRTRSTESSTKSLPSTTAAPAARSPSRGARSD